MTKSNPKAAIDKPIILERLQPKHIDQTVQLFTRSFCDSEPMTRYVKMGYKEFTPFAEDVIEKGVQDGLSVVALDEERVVACAIVEDIAKSEPIGPEIDPKFEPIFAVLSTLDEGFLAGKQFPPNLVAHLFITAVDADYRGYKLSRKVNFGAMELAYDLNFQFMFSEFTNYLNEKGTIKYLENEKLLIGTVPYHAFEHQNKKPFKNLAGTANAYLWELCRDAQLIYKEDGNNQKATLKQLAKELVI